MEKVDFSRSAMDLHTSKEVKINKILQDEWQG